MSAWIYLKLRMLWFIVKKLPRKLISHPKSLKENNSRTNKSTCTLLAIIVCITWTMPSVKFDNDKIPLCLRNKKKPVSTKHVPLKLSEFQEILRELTIIIEWRCALGVTYLRMENLSCSVSLTETVQLCWSKYWC